MARKKAKVAPAGPAHGVKLIPARIFLCPIRECGSNYSGQCMRTWCNYYTQYRETTGLCEICGVSITAHPICDTCGILCGRGHVDDLPEIFRYRRIGRHLVANRICHHCRVAWRKLEVIASRVVTFEEFMDPMPGLFGISAGGMSMSDWRGYLPEEEKKAKKSKAKQVKKAVTKTEMRKAKKAWKDKEGEAVMDGGGNVIARHAPKKKRKAKGGDGQPRKRGQDG